MVLLAGMAFHPKSDSPSFAFIELFTSQGCSSCPPADKLLAKTILENNLRGKNTIALSFHVDYWDRLGWKDPYSNSEFSDRQRNYAEKFKLNSIYTPQAIVNGSEEFVGSNENKLTKAISTYLEKPATATFKSIKATTQQNQSIKVNFYLEGDYTNCVVNVALVSLSEITPVKKGENAGENLEGVNIVRQFKAIKANVNGEIEFSKSPMPAINNRAVVAYIQQKNSLEIIGAVQIKIN